MKAICLSACEIPGLGIVQSGDEIELHDGFYNDERIKTHFHIVESSVRHKNARPPDLLAMADARRERFAKSLADHTAQLVALNRLIDAGVELPRELATGEEDDPATDEIRISKIVELWCGNFGYDFPTDEIRGAESNEHHARQDGDKPAKRGKPPEGENPERTTVSEDQDAQKSLFDKLNGK
ncbi:MAG: hypothetical protein J6W80_06085 [Kiritimatiellae bacterium]|nr:hypothetical protein [Kiritimatiellia bacterium]